MCKTENEIELVKFLMELGALKKEKKCLRGHEMKIRFDGNSLRWKCDSFVVVPKKKSYRCNYSCSIREDRIITVLVRARKN